MSYADLRAEGRSARYLCQLHRQKTRDFLGYKNLKYLFPDDKGPNPVKPGTERVRYTPVHATSLDLRFSRPVCLIQSECNGAEVFWRNGKKWQKMEEEVYSRCWRLRFATSEDRGYFYKGCEFRHNRRMHVKTREEKVNDDDDAITFDTSPADHLGRMSMNMGRRHDQDCTTQGALDVLERTRRRNKMQWNDCHVPKHLCKKSTFVSCKSRSASAWALRELDV